MARCSLWGWVFLALGGCAGPQLREVTVDMGPSFGSLQERQILTNLSSFISKPWSLPGQLEVTGGTLQVQNQATLNWKLPFSGSAQEGDPGGQSQEQDSFSILPITDGDDLRRVRALYRYAVCDDTSEFIRDWEETIRPYEQALQTKTLIPPSREALKTLSDIDLHLAQVEDEISTNNKEIDDANSDLSRPALKDVGPSDPAKIKAQAKLDAAEATGRSLASRRDSLKAAKGAATNAAAPKKAAGTTDKGDQNGAPDSIQLERAKERLILQSLGRTRFVFWTDAGEKTAKISPCPKTPASNASPHGTGPFYPLGSYGGLDLWTDRPEAFSKFMVLVIGSTPNTTGVHALTLGVTGNSPPKIQTSSPTRLQFFGNGAVLQ